jgi:hypothetical protein
MRAPEREVREDKEIARDIVAELYPRESRPKPFSDEDLAEASATYDAFQAMTFLRGSSKLGALQGRQQDNLKNFKAVRKQITGLRTALADTNAQALAMLFSHDTEVKSGKIPTAEEAQKTLDQVRAFTSWLAYLQRRCDFLIAEKPGDHGHVDQLQRATALEAYLMLRRYKITTVGGGDESVLGRVASLLWEGITGEYNKSLRRACKAVLAEAKKQGVLLDVNARVVGHGRIDERAAEHTSEPAMIWPGTENS